MKREKRNESVFVSVLPSRERVVVVEASLLSSLPFHLLQSSVSPSPLPSLSSLSSHPHPLPPSSLASRSSFPNLPPRFPSKHSHPWQRSHVDPRELSTGIVRWKGRDCSVEGDAVKNESSVESSKFRWTNERRGEGIIERDNDQSTADESAPTPREVRRTIISDVDHSTEMLLVFDSDRNRNRSSTGVGKATTAIPFGLSIQSAWNQNETSVSKPSEKISTTIRIREEGRSSVLVERSQNSRITP